MNIAVYCGAASGDDPAFAKAARELGERIAAGGHTLVYGGTNIGLMGLVANGVLEAQGQVIGVVPMGVARVRKVAHEALTQLVETESVAERKLKMIELADAFVALPGGPGTLDEVGDVMALQKMGVLDKPIALVNVKGFYDPMLAMMDRWTSHGFATSGELARVHISDDLDAIFAALGA